MGIREGRNANDLPPALDLGVHLTRQHCPGKPPDRAMIRATIIYSCRAETVLRHHLHPGGIVEIRAEIRF